MRLIDMIPQELYLEMYEIMSECMQYDPHFDPMEYQWQSFALQILLAREVVRQRQVAQVKYEVVSSSPYVAFEQDMCEAMCEAQDLFDILSLVDMDIPLEIIETWTDEDFSSALNWASSVHLRASDNYDVKVPKMPKFLKPYKK